MKKIVLISILIVLLATLGIAGTVLATEETPNLRIGVISDSHNSHDWLKKALTDYKEKGVDVIIYAGDLTQDGLESQMKAFADTWLSVFPNHKNGEEDVVPFIINGNHDLWGDGCSAENWEKYMGISWEEVYFTTVKGYAFVGANWGYEGDIGPKMQAAAAQSGDKPIFYVQHPHPQDTCYGSDAWGDKGAAGKILKNYPNVVAFSGHSHYPLTNERSIWQGEYTSIGTSTLDYVSLESGKDGLTQEDSYKVKEGMYVTVYDDRINIERYSYYYDEPCGEDWVLQLPLKPETFEYTTEKRTLEATAPEFEDGAEAEITGVSTTAVAVKFPAAKLDNDNDIIQSYVVRVKEKATGDVANQAYKFSEFYLGKGRLGTEYSSYVGNLVPGTEYVAEIYAVECFGKESTKPLKIEFTTVADPDYYLNRLTPDILNLAFINGEPYDTSTHKTKISLAGGTEIVFDESLNKYVLNLDGVDDYGRCDFTTAQYNLMIDGFTMETVFCVDENRNQSILSCTEGGGVSFSGTPGGKVQLDAYIGNGYFTDNNGAPSTPVLEKGKYYHLVASFDGMKLEMYLDGEKIYSAKVSETPTVATINSSLDFLLGAEPDLKGGASLFMKGKIALARVYSMPVEEALIPALYDNYKATRGDLIVTNVTGGKIKLYSDEAMKNEITDTTSVKIGDSVYIRVVEDDGVYLKQPKRNRAKFIEGSLMEVTKQYEISAVYTAVKDQSSVPIEPAEGGYVIVTDERISPESLFEYFSDGNNLKVLNNEGKAVTSGYMATGMRVQRMSGAAAARQRILVVKGDTNGDGRVTTSDYFRIRKSMSGCLTLQGSFFVAADINGTGELETGDYLGVKRYFREKI